LEHIYVLAGTGIGVILVVMCFAPPKDWLSPSKWRLPGNLDELGPAFLILVGANAMTAAIRLAALIVLNRIEIRTGSVDAHKSASPTDEEYLYFLAGAFGAFLLGFITTRDGVTRLRDCVQNQGGSRPIRN
jgi:hypothetical protein